MISLGSSLSKLAILAFEDRELNKQVGGMKVAYNPSTVDLNYQVTYDDSEKITEGVQRSEFKKIKAGSLNLDLLFDATLPDADDIEAQIADLRELCCTIDPKIGQTRFLKISWGKLKWHGQGYFAGRARSMGVRYTMFGRNGAPLRATVRLEVVADESLVLQQSLLDIKLPNLTMITVPDLPGLDMLASGFQALIGMIDYGVAAMDYLDMAMENDLDTLDDMEPGDTLVGRKEEA